MKHWKPLSGAIYTEQVRLLYANSGLPIFVSVLAAALLCWSQRDIGRIPLLYTWFATFFVISFTRISLLFLFRKHQGVITSPARWHRFFLFGTYCAAAGWGAASILLFPTDNQLNLIIFFMIMVGLPVGAVSSLCPSLSVVAGFLTLVLVPLALKVITLGNEEAIFLGSLVLLFWIVTLTGSFKLNAHIRENIQLRLQSVERENHLRASEERYRHIFTNAPLGIFQYDAGSMIVDCNEAFVSLLDSSREQLVGLNIQAAVSDDDLMTALNKSLISGEGYFEGEYTSMTSSKKTPVRAFFKAIRSSDRSIIGGVGIVEDFTEKKQSEEKIQYQATYDALTGLPNRRLLLDFLGNEISRAERHGRFGALLFIDLDNFKTINDSLGHSVGDELLKLVAKRITESIRKEDRAARMGGDEFIIILADLDGGVESAANKAQMIAEELSLCLSAPCQIEGHELHITPSIGVSLFPKKGKGVDDILKQADTAMYRAKAAGRNGVRFFLPSMQEAADQRLRINTEIRRALDRGELALFYQPQVNEVGNITGAEALLRWQHPERGLLAPGEFLAVAEETGIMQDIGQWVLQSTCHHIRTWTEAGILEASRPIAVNISGKELSSPGFVETVIRILEETKARPENLGIELTEGSLISTGIDIVEKIMRLRQLGIKFSVDDFGTGYSSLSYLKSLPLHTLKIDRSFVNDIKDSRQGVVLVDTIIMMAGNLGLEVIAEGVETSEELDYLGTRGCSVYQGFYFSKPVDYEAFTHMLAGGSCSPDRRAG